MNTNDRNPNLDPSIRAIEEALDALGAAERARAHGALEQDILRATRQVRAGAQAHSDRPSMFSFLLPRLAFGAGLAAVVAVIVTVAVSSSTHSARQLAQAEKDLDAFLASADNTVAVASASDSTTLVLGDSLVDLKASVAAAEQSIDEFWVVPEENTDPLSSELESSL